MPLEKNNLRLTPCYFSEKIYVFVISVFLFCFVVGGGGKKIIMAQILLFLKTFSSVQIHHQSLGLPTEGV